MSTDLAAVERPQPLSITQLDLIKRTIGSKEMSDDELALFAQICTRTHLDPFQHQIWALWIKGRFQPMVGIEGFRLIAQRSGRYAGQAPVEWCGTDGVWRDVWIDKTPPAAARATVLRHDWTAPMVAVALFAEYSTGEGRWKTAPAAQIAKCAEALALRKSFTEDLSGLYTDDELDNVADPPAAPPLPPAAAPDNPPASGEDRAVLRRAVTVLSDSARSWATGVAKADSIPNLDGPNFRRSHRDRLAWHLIVAQRIKPTPPGDDAATDDPVPADTHDATEPA